MFGKAGQLIRQGCIEHHSALNRHSLIMLELFSSKSTRQYLFHALRTPSIARRMLLGLRELVRLAVAIGWLLRPGGENLHR